ncbi:MAG: hypothetical protein KDB23_14765, partial [Planctomycetales bacterium]|nr:hypothetical protein [Planctomycetales bacterium]
SQQPKAAVTGDVVVESQPITSPDSLGSKDSNEIDVASSEAHAAFGVPDSSNALQITVTDFEDHSGLADVDRLRAAVDALDAGFRQSSPSAIDRWPHDIRKLESDIQALHDTNF